MKIAAATVRRALITGALVVGLQARVAPVSADAAAAPEGVQFVKAREGIEQYRLKSNGMDILLVPSSAAPVVTFLVVVRVGSRNEAPGNTGSAHLLEHMLFNKSTQNFGHAKGKTIQQVLYEAGGDFSTSNMTTWDDRITMYDTLPKDRLETTMKINADRLRRGLILDEERKPEMTVVRNEYERGENDPGEALFKAVNAAAIVAHPYHWDTIGYKSDIEGVSTAQLRRHYDTYFWPDNSTAVLVGDFDRREALAIFEREFGGFSKAPSPIPQVVTVEPPQEGERRVIVRRTGAVPIVTMAWLRPGAGDPQYYAFDVLGSILGDGISARLYQSLVETRLATSVSWNNWSFRDPYLFVLNGTVSQGTDPAKVESAMRDAVQSVRDRGVTVEEVSRAKALIQAQVALSRDGTYATASTIGEAIAARDWEWWVDYRDRIRAVTPADVKAAADQWLEPDRITVGWFVPKDGAGGGSEGAGGGTRGAAPARRGAAPLPGPSAGPGAAAAPALEPGATAVVPAAARPVALASTPPVMDAASSAESLTTAIQNAAQGSAPPPPRTGASPAKKPSSDAAAGSFAARTKRQVLPNGAVLLVLPNNLSDTVSVRVRVRAGSYLDGGMPGIAEATAGMLSRGTRSHSKAEIARRLESVGTTLSWDVQRYDVVGRGACLAENLPELIETIVEELREPGFPPDEIAKLKVEMKAEILQSEDDTGDRAYLTLTRSIYPVGHPLRQPTATEQLAALEKISGDDLRRFHQGHYGGSGIVMSLSGKVPTAGAPGADRTQRLLSGIPRGTTAPVEAARATNRSASRQVVPMKDKANVDMMIGGAGGLRRKDPDYYAAYLANAVLGQSSLSSRLGGQVRDTEGLTYVIISRFFSADVLDGPWGIYLSVAPENVEKGLASTMNVMKKFASEGVSAEELAVEKSAAAGRYQVSLSSNAGIAEALAQAESSGLGVSILDEYPKKIRAVTLEEANRAIKDHMAVDKLTTVIAGSVAP